MNENEPRKRPRWRWGLRGMMALVGVSSLGLVAIRPMVSEGVRYLERYVRVKLNEDDLYRHADIAAIRRLADGFALAIRSGQTEAALDLTTAGFRRRMTPDRFRMLVAEVGLDRGPCDLVEATTAFPEGMNRFVSEYTLRCGPSAGPNRAVKLVVVSEGGLLRVDRLEPDSK